MSKRFREKKEKTFLDLNDARIRQEQEKKSRKKRRIRNKRQVTEREKLEHGRKIVFDICFQGNRATILWFRHLLS